MGKDHLQYHEYDCKVIHESITSMLIMYNSLSLIYMFGDGP